MFRSNQLAAVIAGGVLVLALAACESESFEAQVAAAEAAGDFGTVIELWGPRADEGNIQGNSRNRRALRIRPRFFSGFRPGGGVL